MPSTSKTLKTQATGIKRTVTGIRTAITAQASLLTQKEREQLEKAAEILSRVGGKVSSLSKQTLTQEKVKEKAMARATAEAKRLMSLWPQPTTILEKVALIVGVSSGYNLRRDLEDHRPNADPKWNFNYWFEEAIKNIPYDAAYYSVKNGTPVSELMNEAAAKIEKLKPSSTVKSLAALWQEKLDATAKPE